MICKNCNKEIPNESTFCPYCGEEIIEAVIENKNICEKCKNEIPIGSEYCPYCGNQTIKKKEKVINHSNVIKIPFTKLVIGIVVIVLVIITIVVLNFMKNKKSISNSERNMNTQNTTTNISNESNKNNNVSNFNVNEDIISKEFKLYLSNQEWVEDNLYLKTDYFGDEIDVTQKQKISYCQVSSTMAFVIMEVEEPFTRECFVLNYENNTISVKNLDDEKSRDGYSVDLEKETITKIHIKMGSYIYDIYNFKDNNISKICTLDYYDGDLNPNEEYYKCNDKDISKDEFYTTLRNNVKGEVYVDFCHKTISELQESDFAELNYF